VGQGAPFGAFLPGAADGCAAVPAKRLRTKIRVACDEGIPFAAIARAAGLSRERVRQLYAGR
jgi:hypothetical protein